MIPSSLRFSPGRSSQQEGRCARCIEGQLSRSSVVTMTSLPCSNARLLLGSVLGLLGPGDAESVGLPWQFAPDADLSAVKAEIKEPRLCCYGVPEWEKSSAEHMELVLGPRELVQEEDEPRPPPFPPARAKARGTRCPGAISKCS